MAISVAYYEMAGWPRELVFVDAFAGERKLICAWGDRATLANDILSPGNNVYPYNNSGALVSHVPKIRPLAGGKETQGAQIHMASYEKAVVTVNYSTKGRIVGVTPGGDLISEWMSTGSTFKTLDRTQLAWAANDGEPLRPGEGPDKIEPVANYVLLYNSLPSLPGSVLTSPGTVNSEAVSTYLLGLTFAAETLMYAGSNITRSLNPQGASAFQVRQKFRYRANADEFGVHGWNYFWRTKKNKYEQVFEAGGDRIKPFTPIAFNF